MNRSEGAGTIFGNFLWCVVTCITRLDSLLNYYRDMAMRRMMMILEKIKKLT